jgi:hypothetical protein
MNRIRMMGLIQKAAISLVVASVVVLFLGTVSPVGAEPYKFTRNAKGVSVGDRVQGQTDLCFAGGGTTTVSSGLFRGITSTSCSGGTQDGMKCTNTQNSTTCSMPRTTILSGSKLGEVLATNWTGSLAPAIAPADDAPAVDQGTVNEDVPVVAPEPTATPAETGVDPGESAATEEAPVVAPEPTATPEDTVPVIDDGALADETLAVDPGSDGGAPTSGKGNVVDVSKVDDSQVLLPIDEQP